MNVTLDQYRARIGSFNNRSCRCKFVVCVDFSQLLRVTKDIVILCFIVLILILCGDIETNPGPTFPDSSNTSSIYSEDSESFFSTGMKSFVSLMHLNIQSLKPKIDIINGSLNNFDILRFTESWAGGHKTFLRQEFVSNLRIFSKVIF